MTGVNPGPQRTLCLVDGKRTDSVPADDRGFTYGDGLFETLALVNGRILASDLHLDRLCRDATRLGIEPPARTLLAADLEHARQTRTSGVVRLTLTRGSGGRGYRPAASATCRRILSVHPWPNVLPSVNTPVNVFCCEHTLGTSRLAGIKHLNRLDQVIASREWPDDSYFEGLMTDADGNLVEGTRSNVFLVIEKRLVTPSLARCGVAGVIRNAVLRHCADNGLVSEVRDVALPELARATEIFLTNSIIGLRSVATIAGLRWAPGRDAGLAGPIARSLQTGGLIR